MNRFQEDNGNSITSNGDDSISFDILELVPLCGFQKRDLRYIPDFLFTTNSGVNQDHGTNPFQEDNVNSVTTRGDDSSG